MHESKELTEEQLAFFEDFMREIQRLTKRHVKITNMEFIAIMSRCVGMSVAACAPDEHTRMRDLAIANMDSKIPGKMQ